MSRAILEPTQTTDPLLRQFYAFYIDLERLRRMAQGAPFEPSVSELSRAREPETAEVTSAGQTAVLVETDHGSSIALREPAPDAVTLRVWQEMAQYLDRKLYEARTAVNMLSRDLMEELVYILAAFADETFLCLLDWPGRNYWRDHLLEMRLFGTRVSGQLIFNRIDNLLSRQNFNADEICAIYLTILALGFRGRYLRDPDAVEYYRRRLYDRLLLNHPDLHCESARLLPEAYRYTVVEGSPVRLPTPRTWWMILTGVVIAWLVLSSVAWILLTSSTVITLERTNRSLLRVTERPTVNESSDRWRGLPLVLQDGAFRINLLAPLPMHNASAGNASDRSLAPLLLAVSGENGSSPGTPVEVQSWLARGSIAFTAIGDGNTSKHLPLLSVDLSHAPARGITASGNTEFFLVEAQLSGAELSQQPQLIFPIDEKSSVRAKSLVLYLSRQTEAGTR